MAEIKGYVIGNSDGEYLTGSYFWYPHQKPEEAFVHQESQLEGILTRSQTWDFKPATLFPASYIPKMERNVVSDPINIEGLGQSEILELVRAREGGAK